MISNFNLKNYLKFISLGAIRALFFFSLYVLLINYLYPLIVVIINWFISIPVAIYFHKKYIFYGFKNSFKRLLLNYFSIYFFSLIFNLISLYVFIEFLLINEIISQLCIIILLSIINYFYIQKLYKIKEEVN